MRLLGRELWKNLPVVVENHSIWAVFIQPHYLTKVSRRAGTSRSCHLNLDKISLCIKQAKPVSSSGVENHFQLLWTNENSFDIMPYEY